MHTTKRFLGTSQWRAEHRLLKCYITCRCCAWCILTAGLPLGIPLGSILMWVDFTSPWRPPGDFDGFFRSADVRAVSDFWAPASWWLMIMRMRLSMLTVLLQKGAIHSCCGDDHRRAWGHDTHDLGTSLVPKRCYLKVWCSGRSFWCPEGKLSLVFLKNLQKVGEAEDDSFIMLHTWIGWYFW